MSAQQYMVVVDGDPCVVGVPWREAVLAAGKILQVLAQEERLLALVTAVTVAELELGEPLATWKRSAQGWDYASLPVWQPEAA